MNGTPNRNEKTALNQKRVLIPITHGSSGVDVAGIASSFAKFNAQVITASLGFPAENLVCEMQEGHKIVALMPLETAVVQEWDLIVVPGGKEGSQQLSQILELATLLENHIKTTEKIVGFLNESLDCFLDLDTDKVDSNRVSYQNEYVVTARGFGAASKLALCLGEVLFGKEAVNHVSRKILIAPQRQNQR